MKILTVSRMRARHACPRKEQLGYVECVAPVLEEEALHVGDLVHRGLEAWLVAHRFASDGDSALRSALDVVEGRARDWPTEIKVEEMLRGYDQRWHDEPLQVVGAEEEFCVPLINPETMRESRTWMLAGKIDGRIRIRGELFILEHKTTSEYVEDPSSPYWAKLDMDHQVSAYYLGAEAIAADDSEIPRGCLYDVIKKPGQIPLRATPPELRKYTKEKVDRKTKEILEPSRLYKGQRENDETPEEFRARIRKDIEEKLELYFVRRLVARTETQLKEFMEDAWATARETHETHKRGFAPRNPDACHAYGRCKFWNICSAGVDPKASEDFQILDRPHPELSDEIVGGAA